MSTWCWSHYALIPHSWWSYDGIGVVDGSSCASGVHDLVQELEVAQR